MKKIFIFILLFINLAFGQCVQLEYKNQYIKESGCYLLMLAHYSGYILNDNDYYFFIKKGWITKNCLVKNPEAILKYYTGNVYIAKISKKFDKKAEFTLLEVSSSGKSHFVLLNKNGDIVYDSYEIYYYDKIISYRPFYKINTR